MGAFFSKIKKNKWEKCVLKALKNNTLTHFNEMTATITARISD